MSRGGLSFLAGLKKSGAYSNRIITGSWSNGLRTLACWSCRPLFPSTVAARTNSAYDCGRTTKSIVEVLPCVPWNVGSSLKRPLAT